MNISVTPVTILVGLLVLGITGCGKPSLHVEGMVEWDGAPLETGAISFEPKNAKGRDFGGIITAGKFKIVSPPGEESGVRIVRITAIKKTGKKIPAGSPLPAGSMVDETIQVPKCYNEKSELTADLSNGDRNPLIFKLVSTPK